MIFVSMTKPEASSDRRVRRRFLFNLLEFIYICINTAMKRSGRALSTSGRYRGLGKWGHATFEGKHNRNRLLIYCVLMAYSKLYPRGQGLLSDEIATLTGLELLSCRPTICKSLDMNLITSYLHLGRRRRQAR